MLMAAGATPLEAEPSEAVLRDFGRDSRDVLRGRLRRYRVRYLEIAVPKKAGPSDTTAQVIRFGGRPSLPASEWPQGADGPMLFVGQIALAELKQSPLPLPKSGLLCFFVEPFPYASGRVVYREEAHAEGADAPSLLKGSYPMKFKRVHDALQIPHPHNFYFRAIAEPSISAARDNPVATLDEDDMVRRICAEESHHQIGGHPFQLQDDPRMAIDATVVLLLHVDQFNVREDIWGDNGIGHFFIKLEDLERGAFDEAFFAWACH